MRNLKKNIDFVGLFQSRSLLPYDPHAKAECSPKRAEFVHIRSRFCGHREWQNTTITVHRIESDADDGT